MSNFLIRALMAGILVWAGGFTQEVFGQRLPVVPNTARINWHLGYNGFRMLLEERGLSPRLSLDATLATPTESVVVLFGDLSAITRDDWLRMRRFVAQGGGLLIASERAFRLPGVSQFSRGPVSAVSEGDMYQGFADCLGLSVAGNKEGFGEGLRRIVVNKSGWLTLPEDKSLNWEIVATLPADCEPFSARGKPVLMVGTDQNGPGVMIMAADQSLFSDGMLWHGDNSILAIRTSERLVRGSRRWLAVYENGRILPGYHQSVAASRSPEPSSPQPPASTTQPPPVSPEPELPEPEPETLLKIANRVINEVQQSNILNETLKERPRNVRPVAWLRTVLLLLLILLVMYVVWRLSQNRWHVVPNRHTRFLQSMYGVLSSKQIATSEFGAAAEILSRDLCAEITGSSVETDWMKLLGNDKAPPVSGLPRSLRSSLMELVSIATRGCRIHLSQKKFQTLGRAVQQLRIMHREKRFVVTLPR